MATATENVKTAARTRAVRSFELLLAATLLAASLVPAATAVATEPGIAVSTDRWILDQAKASVNLGRYIVEEYVPDARIVPLRMDIDPS